MGNWRTVVVIGTVDKSEVEALQQRVTYTDADWNNFGPLSYNPQRPSLFGLCYWVGPTIVAAGNLAERDYSVERVADELTKFLAIAPSLNLKVHCGGDWESEQCIATITVEDGVVEIGKPEVTSVHGVSEGESIGRFAQYLK